ncbi:hypothetical protein [Cryptosporangium aurantiacum]|uniref:Uncharacterized protein n=1 Tax=Cryptosporangium aurantiacum TaxID=134849 RepID=A0A1M7JUV4_9ACTN|nr:hypothetical protein [Cryptosporangium aurantiacum]SHM56681.1 hypothetical protein SAMN05443668_101910 [Cryptosporangium aurantiacum]
MNLVEARQAVEWVYGPRASGIWGDLLLASGLEGTETDPAAFDRLLAAMRSAAPVTALCGEALMLRAKNHAARERTARA